MKTHSTVGDYKTFSKCQQMMVLQIEIMGARHFTLNSWGLILCPNVLVLHQNIDEIMIFRYSFNL
jgi:hypothetical protein